MAGLQVSHEGRIARVSSAVFVVAALADALEAERSRGEVRVVALELQDADAGADGFGWLERFELPVICAFEGAIEAGAAQLALACDVRICGADASIRAPVASQRRLRRLLRDEQVLAKCVSGHTLMADEALEGGLVSKVMPAGGAVGEATRMAEVMASRGPIALRLAKEAIWRGLEMPLEQGLRFETDLTLLLQTTKDRAEGVRAFMEKRPPRFTGE